jgi:signal transduction histidine kinase
MDEAVKKKMLTPYFSTSKDGSGFGIGTIIIQQVIELHQGKLLVNSLENQGTELIFQLPKLKLFK